MNGWYSILTFLTPFTEYFYILFSSHWGRWSLSSILLRFNKLFTIDVVANTNILWLQSCGGQKLAFWDFCA